MKKKYSLILSLLCVGASSALGITANINYGSAAAAGGGLFLGGDSLSADSITVGYFTGVANAGLTDWFALDVDSTFPATGFNAASVSGSDVTAASGFAAWVLVIDGVNSGLIRANDWAVYSGTDSPSPTPLLTYQFDLADTSATVSLLGDLVVANNAGQGGASGISISVVPEPSAYAALAGLCALSAVMVRRRRA